MEHKKVLVIKDYHNNTDQESRQAHRVQGTESYYKVSFEIKKINLKEKIKQIQWNLYSGDTLRTKASVPWIEVPPD